jgi:hypothetical protein
VPLRRGEPVQPNSFAAVPRHPAAFLVHDAQVIQRACVALLGGGRADYCAPMIASFRVLLSKVGAMTEAETTAFVDGLERASAENRFFGARNFYSFIARRSNLGGIQPEAQVGSVPKRPLSSTLGAPGEAGAV